MTVCITHRVKNSMHSAVRLAIKYLSSPKSSLSPASMAKTNSLTSNPSKYYMPLSLYQAWQENSTSWFNLHCKSSSGETLKPRWIIMKPSRIIMRYSINLNWILGVWIDFPACSANLSSAVDGSRRQALPSVLTVEMIRERAPKSVIEDFSNISLKLGNKACNLLF